VKKILTWGGVALLLYLVVQDPQSATRLVSGTIDLLGRIAEGATAIVNGV
jgi:anaerobic glycerol-3-phosphate dehydrogenase